MSPQIKKKFKDIEFFGENSRERVLKYFSSAKYYRLKELRKILSSKI